MNFITTLIQFNVNLESWFFYTKLSIFIDSHFIANTYNRVYNHFIYFGICGNGLLEYNIPCTVGYRHIGIGITTATPDYTKTVRKWYGKTISWMGAHVFWYRHLRCRKYDTNIWKCLFDYHFGEPLNRYHKNEN